MAEFKSANSYWTFADRVRRKARFIRTSEDEDFLREVVRTSKARIREQPASFGLWRAQLGHDWRQEDENPDHILPAPYCSARMKPQQGRAKEGRANPKGISVLYLSTNKETAMSEVRPWIGSFVSCAYFKTTRPLRIVDFSIYHYAAVEIYDGELDASEREKAVWTQIDQAFSEPTTVADDVADYVPTQVITELFKAEGYDGIAYKSAFGDNGYNVVLFDPADAKLEYRALYEVKSLKFVFDMCANPYWVEEDVAEKTPTVVAVRPARPSDKTDS